jgi:hypothetical protein
MGRKPALTPEQADEVRRFYGDRAAKWTVSALAHSYGVKIWTINAVLERRGAYRPDSLTLKG